MSETIEVDSGSLTRQPRGPRERSMESERIGPAVIVEGPAADDSPSAEDALAEAHRVIADRDAANRAANERAERAEREAARIRALHQQNRGAAIAAAVEAATSAQATARAALKQAREQGDVDAEADATMALSQATFRLEAAKSASMAAEPTSAAGNTTEQPTGGGRISNETQDWINRHPKFNTDPAYKAAMMSRHYDLVKDGYAPDSPAYFRELDKAAAALEGGNAVSDSSPGRRDQFTGAPPSRGGSGASSSNTVQTDLGPITATRRGDKISVKVPDHLLADFKEGADICKMPLGDYIYDQWLIATGRARGENTGLVTLEGREGRTYR